MRNLASIGIRVGGAALGYGSTLLLAASIDPSEFGAFTFALTLAAVIGLLGQAGLPVLVLRETAALHARQASRTIRKLWSWAILLLLGASALAGGLYALVLSFQSTELFVPAYLIIGGSHVFVVGLLACIGAAMRGVERNLLGQATEGLWRQFLFLAFCSIALLVIGASEITGELLFLMSLAAALGASVLGAAVLCRESMSVGTHGDWDRLRRKSLLASSLVLGVGSWLSALQTSADVLLLGLFSSIDNVAVYRVMITGAAVVQLGLSALVYIYGPAFARAHALNDPQLLRINARECAVWSFLTSAMFCAALFIASGPLVRTVLGSPYYEAMIVLHVLLGANLVSSVFGAGFTLLNMTGNEKWALRSAAIGAVSNVVLCFVLIPRFGILGAAFGSGISVVLWRLTSWFFVLRQLGFDSSIVGALLKRPHRF